MPTDHYAFRAMALEEQVYTVINEGKYLARRYEEGCKLPPESRPAINKDDLPGPYCTAGSVSV